jgi:hypothetical protein
MTDMHSISGVIARQLYLAHDVRANIERQIDDALRTARNEALEEAAQLFFPDISFSQGLEIATAIRRLKEPTP